MIKSFLVLFLFCSMSCLNWGQAQDKPAKKEKATNVTADSEKQTKEKTTNLTANSEKQTKEKTTNLTANSEKQTKENATVDTQAKSKSSTLSNKSVPEEWTLLKKDLKNRKSSLTSPLVQRRLKRIHHVMGKKDSEDQAIALIEKLEKVVQKRLFDLARLYHLKAQIYLSKDDFKNAVLYYNKAIDLKKLSYTKHLSVVYDMAFLYLLQNNIQKASQLTDQLFYLAEKVNPPAYILKASILMSRKQTQPALEMVMKAIQATSRPKESWLAFGAALNIELKKYVPAVRLLIQLTGTYPNKKKYWKQLSAVYLNINKDDRALATLDLAYKLDFLEKEQEILHLTGLLMYQGLLFKAARLLEQSIRLKKVKPTQKNYEILGDCWLRAEETAKALQAYNLAASSARDGKIFAKMGRIYMSNQNWRAVIDNFKKTLDKGGIKHPANIHIAIGIAYINLKKYKSAVKSFEQVINTKAQGQLIKRARQWIDYAHSLMREI